MVWLFWQFFPELWVNVFILVCLQRYSGIYNLNLITDWSLKVAFKSDIFVKSHFSKEKLLLESVYIFNKILEIGRPWLAVSEFHTSNVFEILQPGWELCVFLQKYRGCCPHELLSLGPEESKSHDQILGFNLEYSLFLWRFSLEP